MNAKLQEALGQCLDVTAAKALGHAYEGYDSSAGGWPIPSIFNAHDHLRNPYKQHDLFSLAVQHSAAIFDDVTAMPNLGEDRIRTADQCFAYQEASEQEGRKTNPLYRVTVPLYLEPDTTWQTIVECRRRGASISAKLYPKAGTTGSDEGVDFREIDKLFPVFDAMQDHSMRLLVHGEMVRDQTGLIPDRLREPKAVEVIEVVSDRFPGLQIVFEHISKREGLAGVRRWRAAGRHIQATVAAQYLCCNGTILTLGGMNPTMYSIPILGDEEDRVDLVNFTVNESCGLGTDSAPHAFAAKSQAYGCPGGVFNNPTAILVYFHYFRMYGGPGWYKKLIRFLCTAMREFYGFPLLGNEPRVLIRETSMEVPEFYEKGSARVIPLFAGLTLPYSYSRV